MCLLTYLSWKGITYPSLEQQETVLHDSVINQVAFQQKYNVSSAEFMNRGC